MWSRTVAPVGGWRRLARDSWLVTSTGLITDAVGVVVSLALRMVLDPAQMGVWQGLKLLLGYANYSNLGISKGALREYNVAQGHGRLERARHGLNLGHTVNTLGSLWYSLILIAAGLWLAADFLPADLSVGRAGPRDWWAALAANPWCGGLFALGALALVQRHLTYQVSILRCQRRFDLTSRQSLLEAALTLILAVGGAWCWGLPGLWLGTLAVMLVASLYLRRSGQLRLGWAWDRAEISRLVAIGSPMLLAGVLASLFRSVDKLAILYGMPDREVQLGTYSLAMLVGGQLFGLGNTVSLAVGPRFAELFGKTGSRREAARLAARTSEVQTAAVSMLAALVVTAAPPLLAWLLPRYAGGSSAIAALVPGTVALVWALPAQQWLSAVDRQQRALAIQVASLLLAVLLEAAAIGRGTGLVGIALATSVAYLAHSLALVAFSFWPLLPVAERLRYLGTHFLALTPLAVALALAATTADAAADPWSIGGTLLRMGLVLSTAGGILSWGWHRAGWRQAWQRELPT